MLGRALGAVLVGIEARPVEVEVDLGGGLPTIAAVGLADGAVREGIDRIRAALPHAGFRLPQRRVIVNLAPADLRKHGTGLDLPIAAALLSADGQIPPLDAATTALAGELGLDGTLRPVRGSLPIALAVRAAGRRRLLVAEENAAEAALVTGIDVVPLRSLAELRAWAVLPPVRSGTDLETQMHKEERAGEAPDLREIRGQAAARRALEIAAAGGHHLLLIGPPGAGKTMLARRLPSILPPLHPEEALEVTRIWSASGLTSGLVRRRPFRAPHHGTSPAGLVGGGAPLRPGEATLAHHGVLYLDELPEFRRDALEALRQPLEDGEVHVTRVRQTAILPARFTWVASMNPCPCGWHGQPGARCRCSPLQVAAYLGRVSGPLLDRIDLTVEVPPVDLSVLARGGEGESSARVRERVLAARLRQRARFGPDGPSCNAQMRPRELDRCAVLGEGPRRLLVAAGARLRLSARGYDRVRRLACTLRDLEGTAEIGEAHVAEAVQYRPRFVEEECVPPR